MIRAMPTIRDITVTLTTPAGWNFVVVCLHTDEPGLYGLGCGTFTQRALAVQTTIEQYLRPLIVGRDATRIEELWRLMMQNGYWRNGPVLNNAVSAIDIALWDLKGKQAGLPIYDLLGGKYREAAAVYEHTDAPEQPELMDNIAAAVERGVRFVRIQLGGQVRAAAEATHMPYGGAVVREHRPEGALDGAYSHPRRHVERILGAVEAARSAHPQLELIHDAHGRLEPNDAVAFAKDLEPYKMFFLEDPLPPEQLDWLERLRAHATTPIAIGELFAHPQEWRPLVSKRQLDFLRMHISSIGGLTPARKAAAVGELHGVRTAWHGPGDVSPLGHAAQLHLDLAAPNFGIQEMVAFPEAVEEVFPGTPKASGGYVQLSDKPGLGVDFNAEAAARFPPSTGVVDWTQTRLPDGSLHWP